RRRPPPALGCSTMPASPRSAFRSRASPTSSSARAGRACTRTSAVSSRDSTPSRRSDLPGFFRRWLYLNSCRAHCAGPLRRLPLRVMARVGALDFSGFVEHRQHLPGTRETGGAHAYAYVSDKQTRSAFDRVKPVQYAVSAAVRLFKAFGKRDLCGHAVRVGPKQFPKIHALTKHCADTLGIE